MPTTVTKTIKSAGGDHSTLSAWEAANQADIVAADQVHEAECFGFLDNSATVTIDGWTTDATRFIRIFASTGAEATMPYTTTGYRLERTASADTFINAEDYVRVERITFKATNSGGSNSWCCYNTNGAGDVRYVGCLVQVPLNSATATGIAFRHAGTGGKVSVINCVAYTTGTPGAGGGLSAFVKTQAGSTFYVYNCLAYRVNNAFQGNSGTGLFKNCIYDVADLTAGTIFSNIDSASNYLSSSEAGAPGANSRSSQTFTYVDEGAGNFHLAAADGGAKGFGVNLSGDANFAFSTDFDGASRSDPWDIGPTVPAAAAGAGGPLIGGKLTDSNLLSGRLVQ